MTSQGNVYLVIILILPVLAALLVSLLTRNVWSRWVTVIPALIFAYFLLLFNRLTSGAEPSSFDLIWFPSLGISLELFADGLGVFFGLIISGIGTLILLYASAYFKEHDEYVRFSAYTLLFMAAMLGIVISRNLLVMFIFWELTSITSYLLIGFKHESDEAREGARRALLVTGGGGLAMLAGIILLGLLTNSYEWTGLRATSSLIKEHTLYPLIVGLILLGAFTKSAQYPMHFWLPGAMEAPTPASAYLHSATMVKAGIFLLARMTPILGGTPLWTTVLSTVGLFTFIYGGFIALRRTDLKAILAYSTVSWLGALVAVQASGSKDGLKAMLVGVLAHALYKGGLFLTVGSIDHGTGTRELTRLGRLARLMPYTTAGAALAALSMAGIPPLLGFLGKETLKVAGLDTTLSSALQIAFPVLAVLGSALTVAIAFYLLWDVFFGPQDADTPSQPHEVSPLMWLGPLTLGVFTLVLPFLLKPVLDPLLSVSLTSILGKPTEVELHLFEGVNTPLLMSLLGLLLGSGLFAVRYRLIPILRRLPTLNPVIIYEWIFLRHLPKSAAQITYTLQDGRLRHYIVMVASVFVVFSIALLGITQVGINWSYVLANIDYVEIELCILLIVGAIIGVNVESRLGAIVVLGIEGALIALTFALFGAPDLAFTQLTIEVIALVMFVLAFYFLPDLNKIRIAPLSRLRDLFIAAMVGLTTTLLVLIANSNKIASPIGGWYIQNALPVGHGSNVVNVILVDFRGFDTMGEITVLVIAAMGVTALLHLRPSGQARGTHVITEMPVEPFLMPDFNEGIEPNILEREDTNDALINGDAAISDATQAGVDQVDALTEPAIVETSAPQGPEETTTA